MNALERFLIDHGMDEKQAMNDLQENGVISDHAVHPCDVASVNALEAANWLKSRISKKPKFLFKG